MENMRCHVTLYDVIPDYISKVAEEGIWLNAGAFLGLGFRVEGLGFKV